jgi:hypothetical protein
MGEELGYLLEEIQLSFWIDFTERDIIEATTVGDLFDQILKKMGQFESPRCLTSAAFYRLRRSLAEVSGVDRRSITHATVLRNLVPPSMRRNWWEAIETNLRLRLPALRPSWPALFAYWSAATVAVVAIVVGLSRSWEGKFIMSLALLVLSWGLVWVASHLRQEFPVETLEELVRRVVTLNQQKLTREAGGSTRDQAWAAFLELVSGISGIPVASISRETRFPEDLKIF